MDFKDIALLFAGFAMGLVGSLVVEAYNRFKATIEAACRVIRFLESHFPDPRDVSGFVWTPVHAFADVDFDLALQQQSRVRARLTEFRENISMVIDKEKDYVASLPDDDVQLISFDGGRAEMWQVRVYFGIHRVRDRWIEQILEIEPDYSALIRTSLPFFFPKVEAGAKPVV